jgi:hypothetical protein
MRITVKQLKRLIKEALRELPPKIDPSTYKPNKSEPVCGLLVNGVSRSSYTTLKQAEEVAKVLIQSGYDVEIVDFKGQGTASGGWEDFSVRGADAYLTNRSAEEIMEIVDEEERIVGQPRRRVRAASTPARPHPDDLGPYPGAGRYRSAGEISTGYIPGYNPPPPRRQMGVNEGRYRRNK